MLLHKGTTNYNNVTKGEERELEKRKDLRSKILF
jgi:hypothetical protein